MHAILSDAAQAPASMGANPFQADHGRQSRQMRKRIMAALRLASRVVVFGRRARIGAFGAAGGAVAVVISASGLLLTNAAFAASTCQTGTASAYDVSGTGDCIMGAYTPQANDGETGEVYVTGGDTVTLTTKGQALKMTNGAVGTSNVSLGSLLPETNSIYQLAVSAKTNSINTPDPITGSLASINTYKSSNFSQSVVGSSLIGIPVNVGDGQYIDLSLGTVSGAGSTLKVDIGTNSTAGGNAIVTMGVKNTNYVEADNGGTVIWESKNQIYWNGNDTKYAPAGTLTTSKEMASIVTYTGSFTGLDGQTYNVTDLASLQAYNNTIIAQMQAGSLSSGSLTPQQVYDKAFALAYSTTSKTYTAPYTIDAGDDTTQPIGEINAMYINGAGSRGIVASTAELWISGAPLNAVNGGTIQIDKGAIVSGTYTALKVQSGSTAVNNGVISGGFFHRGAADASGNGLTNLYLAYTAQVSGANSSLTNNGIINMAGGQNVTNYAVQVSNGGTAKNSASGIMNVGVANDPGTYTGSMTGALVQGGTFSNDGLIYIGRGSQYNVDSPEQTADTIVKTPTYAIQLSGGTAGTGINNGIITIGTQSQNVQAMYAGANTVGTLINNGTININGAAAGTPGKNMGMSVKDSTATVSNAGIINVNGVNGFGIMVEKTGNIATAATSTGTINVAGVDNPASTARNYGVYATGTGATANVNGAVNLTGDGAIGMHAREGAIINIGSSGAVNFVSGSNQIGVFVYGAGTTISNSATSLNVGTQNSTLFMIASGASFNGGGSSTLIGSGAGSTVVRVHDAGSTFSSGAATINLTGDDATGVLVEGGGKGVISADARINMNGVGVVAGIADGQNHDSLSGAATGTPVASTSLTSSAQLNSALDEVIGYIARNQAQFTNSGNISFTGAHTTGISVETGATATNSGNISVTNGGTGINVASGSSGLTTIANNSGSVTVNGGSTADRSIGVLADGGKATANMQDGSTLKLNGTGAIGAQALNGATITIAGSALPVFGGSDEIAFHALGAGSTIANTATALDASGVRSTLFRIEDGATLSSTAALTTSGAGSVAINATGSAASVGLTGGSLAVSGSNATGIIVEGGATGTIAGTVTATLSGAGGTVGIVDGQKHDLSGANAGSVQATTSLTNAATVNASASDVIGFIARNQGQFTNTGALNFTGSDAIGIAVATGATANNSGAIAITNGSAGIYVTSKDSMLATTANNSAAISVNGGSMTNRTIGVIADGAMATANLKSGSTLSLNGAGAIGAQALNGGNITVTANATPVFGAADQIAFHAMGSGSTIASAATSFDATTQNSTVLRIEDGASLTTNSALTASGAGATGVNATGSGAAAILASGALNVTGENAVGLRVEGGATGTIKAGVSASLTGANAHIGVADGQKHLLDGSAGSIAAVTTLTNQAAITVDGSDATAFVAQNRATIVNQGAISLTGSNGTAVHVQTGATLTNQAAITVADGTAVLLEGTGSSIANSQSITASDGIAALALQNGAAVLASAGSYVGAGSAHGVLLGDATAAFSAGAATLASNGSGNALENAAELAGIDLDGTIINVGGAGNGIRTATATVTDATASINVTGAGTGYQFQQADGAASANDLNLGTGYVFSLTGAGATGVHANTSGAVEVDATIDVSGAGATGVNIAAAGSANIGGAIHVGEAGGAALQVATGNLVSNSGTLTSKSAAAVVDLAPATAGAQFTNVGTIEAAGAADLAIQGTDAGNQLNLAGGAIAGIVRGGAAADMVSWSAGTLNGSIEMGAGKDSLTIADKSAADLAQVHHLDGGPLGDGEAGDTLTLSNVQSRGGTFAADDLGKGINLMAGWDTINLTNGTEWELTDKLTLEDPELNIDATSSLLAGNGVHPVISATDGLVTLNNAGLIDLTNVENVATDSLTLVGTYVGKSGAIAFQTVLGDDTSATDRFIVQGDTAGTSLVTVINAKGEGAMTNEGIEIISVSGASNGSFELVGEYPVDGKDVVVGGAYAYQLYQGNRTGSETKNWYLRTEYTPPESGENGGNNGGLPPVNPPTGSTTDPVTPADPADPVVPVKPLYQAGVPSYEAYPQALLGMNGLGTLQQRVGNRFWSGKGNRVVAQGADAIATPYAAAEDAGSKAEGNGVWGRIEGAHDHIEPRSSTSSTGFDQNRLKMQAGIDGLLGEQDNGSLIGGLFVHYAHGKTKTTSHHGDGEISTDGYGLGGTLTWYGDNGLYVDGQAQVTWYQSDLTSTLARRGLTDGNDGIGYALSLESGKRIALNDGWSVTPQAQLSWSGVDFDTFTDTFGANVSLDRGNSLQGRLGITLDHEAAWQNENGLTDRAHVYGIANLYNEFLDGTRVDVAGVSFASKQDRLWGGLGLGGSYNWNDDKYSIYGEGLVNTSLTSFGDSYSVRGNAGFRVKW